MHHRYIYWVSHWLGKIQSPGPCGRQNLTRKNIQSKDKKQNQILSATLEKIKLKHFRKLSIVPLNLGLQWVNVKQKLFR